MRIYVGTLYTIENDFDECVASIKKQTYRNFEHFVFKGLPNKEAHDTLFRDFLEKSEEFDLMVKVDADMVIENEHLFERIIGVFKENPILDLLSIAIYDWFSNRLILGLNTYRNNIKWKECDEDLFVDGMPLDKGLSLLDWKTLAPAAIHCKNPSPFQAFHFGIHKGLKIIQPNRSSVNREHWRMRFHWENIQYTYNHFRSTGDVRLGYAIIGTELAFAGVFEPEHISYSNPFAKEVFQNYQELSTPAIKREIYCLRRQNWGWLPMKTRKALLWYLFRDKRFSFHAIKSLLIDAFLDRKGIYNSDNFSKIEIFRKK